MPVSHQALKWFLAQANADASKAPKYLLTMAVTAGVCCRNSVQGNILPRRVTSTTSPSTPAEKLSPAPPPVEHPTLKSSHLTWPSPSTLPAAFTLGMQHSTTQRSGEGAASTARPACFAAISGGSWLSWLLLPGPGAAHTGRAATPSLRATLRA